MGPKWKEKYFDGHTRVIQGDSLDVMDSLLNEGQSFEMVFADPPFNLGKQYKSRMNDALSEAEYLTFQINWLTKATALLEEGGSLFVYNIPKWNVHAASYLMELGLNFRHWIAIDMTLGLPVKGRLYPSHYSLLYFTKGKPTTFTPERTPIVTCRHCGGDVKDYGGHRNKIHKEGLNLKDIWTDIGKVSGKKNRSANELPEKLLERVVNMSTRVGDRILDPFCGSGTTLAVARKLMRDSTGIELDDCEDILGRLK